MKGSTGCPTGSVSYVVPHLKELRRGAARKLSEEAKRRLKIFDYYYHSSARFSANGKPNAVVTCRYFGIARSYFYRWKARYNPHNLSSLENKSTAPKKKRGPCYSRDLVRAVRDIRKENPTYSGRKIKAIFEREKKEAPSAATICRLIRRENLFFRSDVKRRRKHSKAALKAHKRLRKPANLKADAPGQIIEFDMKHIYLLGQKHYAFCAIDIFAKEALIHVASSPSSLNAQTALEKVIARWGRDIKIVNDNGSENMDKAEKYLASLGVVQYWTHPYAPKEKPFVERLIGTLQRECLDYHYEPMNVAELREVVGAWLEKYHFYRPHASLGLLTPAEFCDKLGAPIRRVA